MNAIVAKKVSLAAVAALVICGISGSAAMAQVTVYVGDGGRAEINVYQPQPRYMRHTLRTYESYQRTTEETYEESDD